LTGASGYLGSHIDQYLRSLGYSVRAAFRRSLMVGADSVCIDWDSYKSLLDVCADIDVIIHCAGADSAACAKDPVYGQIVNCEYTERLSMAAAEKGVKRVIFLSSSRVYGDNPVGSIDESRPTTYTSEYGCFKLLAEQHLASWDSVLRSTSLRLCNVVAQPPSLSNRYWTTLFPDLCRQLVQHREVRLRSNPSIMRSFIALPAFLDILRQLLVKLESLPSIINICGRTMSLYGVASCVLSVAEKEFGIRVPLVIDEVATSQIGHMFVYKSMFLDSLVSPVTNSPEKEVRKMLAMLSK